MADAVLFLMQNFDANDIGEFVYIGTGEDIKIKELAEIINGIAGYEGNIGWDETRPDGMSRKLLNVQKLNILSWKCSNRFYDNIL